MIRFLVILALFLSCPAALASCPAATGHLPETKGTLQASCEGPDGVRWAVTDAGEILRSPDGDAWTVFDFNAEYAGYYPQMSWRAVAAGGGSVMVAGLDADGHLAIYTSSRGTVWSVRVLEYTRAGERYVLDVVPASLSYDAQRDSYVLQGTDGTRFEMPGCSHCNQLM